MRRKGRVIGDVLDAVIQVISLAIVQKHLATKIKRLSLEVLGAIARIRPDDKNPTDENLFSLLKSQMRGNSSHDLRCYIDNASSLDNNKMQI
ncbi:hypothetical protein Tco_1135843 [Tanacetum coccineum]